ERHAFHTVAEQRQVALLHRIQPLTRAAVVQVHVAADDPLELDLRLGEVILAAPQRVIGINADQGDRGLGILHPPSVRPAGPGPQMQTGRPEGRPVVSSGWQEAQRSPSCCGWPPAPCDWAYCWYSCGVSTPSPSLSAWSNTLASCGMAAASSRLRLPSPSASRSDQLVWPWACGWAAASPASCAKAIGMATAKPRASRPARGLRTLFIQISRSLKSRRAAPARGDPSRPLAFRHAMNALRTEPTLPPRA